MSRNDTSQYGLDPNTALTALDAGGLVAGLVPGPIGNIAQVGIAPFQGDLQAQVEREQLGRDLNMDLKRAGKESSVIKRKLRSMQNYWKDRTGEAIASLIGGGVGMILIGTMAAGLPFGIPLILGMGGALAGGLLANKLYNAAFPREEQDAAQITAQISQKQQHGDRVTAEAVFASLAAGLKGKAGKKLEKELERLSGTRDFKDALMQGHFDVLHHLMKEYDTVISSHYPDVPGNVMNPNETLSERYAYLINTRQMDARLLVLDKELNMFAEDMAHRSSMPGMDMAAMPSPAMNLPHLSPGKNNKGRPILTGF